MEILFVMVVIVSGVLTHRINKLEDRINKMEEK